MNQNYMNRKKWNDYKIDNRNAADIEVRMKELAASYVPEWHFDQENPDIGSVIGKIYARHMEDNINKYNQVLEKYQTEFVNMLGISLLPAKPAMATVLLENSQDTVPGVEVYKGTKFLTETFDGAEEMIFEALHNLYVTSANVDFLFMTQQEEGKIIPLKGEFQAVPLLDGNVISDEEENEEETELSEEEKEAGLKAFRLFASNEAGIGKNALLLYHSHVFQIENNDIYIKITGNKALLELIRDGVFTFSYYTQKGLVPVEECSVLLDKETVVLRKKEKCADIEIGGKTYGLIALLTNNAVKESLTVSKISLASSGSGTLFEAVNNGMTDFEPEDFSPFTDTLSLFQECYLGHDAYFSKAGSKISITFDTFFEENRILVSTPEEENDLRIIKKKPRVILTDAAAIVKADEISLEYFNGIGWKKLVCDQDVRKLFADEHKGKYSISFVCPEDWEPTEAGAYQGRVLRMQLLKADNCYTRPSIHHYPNIKNARIAFSYEKAEMEPQKLVTVSGTKKYDITRQMKEEKEFTVFTGNGYEDDALYLGFKRKIESGPVSILFQMEDGKRFEGTKCKFEYSNGKDFKQMRVQDQTADMSRSGTVMFLPPTDMQQITLEGKTAYWIRLSRADASDKLKEDMLPIIRDICFNAMMVTNIETKPEENFYLEEAVPNTTVFLGISHILDVDLWVNETGRYSKSQMLNLWQEMPEDVQIEKDIIGEISAFYVRWQEVEQFDDPPTRRCYLLDRMTSQIIFGDGIRVDIPRVTDDISFRATIRCCNGAAGNVGPKQITDTMNNLLFVDNIYNPVKAYGGSSMETVENALKRGANILKSRRRLVSEDDYTEEILSYSDNIDKVKCVVGETITGKKIDSALTFAVLLKDFQAGSYSFHNLAGNLKKHLINACELTVTKSNISIVEPIFVEVSVDVWAQIPQMDDSFEVQNLLTESLEEYLNPISSDSHPGWEIGVIPKKSQLMIRLNILKSKAIIKKMVATVRYTDKTGTYELDLEDLKANPFMVCCSGEHHVNVMLSKE